MNHTVQGTQLPFKLSHWALPFRFGKIITHMYTNIGQITTLINSLCGNKVGGKLKMN